VRRTLLIVAIALGCAVAPLLAWSQECGKAGDTDKLFEQVFGKRPGPTGAQPSLEVPLVVDRVDRGTITIDVTDDPFATQIDRFAFIDQVEDFLTEEGAEALNGLPDDNGKFTIGDLFDIGITAEFDSAELVLRVDIDPRLRKALALSMTNRGRPPSSLGGTLGPDAVSGYINLRTGYDNVHETSGNGETGRRDARVEFSGALALPESALDYRFSYNEESSRPWQRGDLRVLRDLPDRALRWTYGDLSFPTTNYQAFVPMGGVTFARNYALQPYVVTEPVTSNQFVLRTPSTVEVVVNGAVVRSFRLPAGRYDLRDLPLGSGVNDVILRITNDVGEVEELKFSLFFDADLLGPGIDQFSASLGMPAEEMTGHRTYDTSRATFSGNYRRGISQTLTLGGDLQGNKNQQLLGGQALWATGIGTIEGRLATSYIEGANADVAARLGYRRRGTAGTMNRNFDLSLAYTGQRFAALGSTQPNGNAAFDTSVRYSQRLPMKLSGSVGGTFRLARNSARNSGNVSASLSRQLARGANLSLDVQRSRDNTGLYDNRAFLSLNISLAGTGQTISSTRDTNTGVSRVDWAYRPERVIGGVAASAGVQRSSGNNRLTGELSRTGYRAEASISHDVTVPRNNESEAERVTSARIGTALVFAGGHVAVSRPVTDAFALIVPHPSLKGQTVGINPRGERAYVAEADRFGPAVVPDLSSYQVRRVLVDVPDLPIGAELGKDVFDVVPTVRSGTTINVGTAASVLIEFTIVDDAGEPISLQAGEIRKLDDDAFEPLLVFSNRGGVMTSDGVVPGKYELTLFAFPDLPVAFEIAEDASGIIGLGTFKFATTGAVHEDAPTIVVPQQEAPAKPDADDLAPVREAEAETPAAQPEPETQIARREEPAETPPAVTTPQAETKAAPKPEQGATPPAAAPQSPARPQARGALPREFATAPQNFGTYRIQLAAFRTPRDAEAAWPTIRDRHDDLLTVLQAVVVEVDLGTRGTFYRLQAGPLADIAAARQLCVSLRERGQSCLIVSPAGAPPADQPPAPGRNRADVPETEEEQIAAAVPAVPVQPVATQTAPAPLAPLAPLDPQPATTGAARIQLASLRTAAAAGNEARRLKRAYSDLLGAVDLTVVTIDLGPPRGVFHRIQSAPLADDATARRLCAALRTRGQGCLEVPTGTAEVQDLSAPVRQTRDTPSTQPPALRNEDRVPAPPAAVPAPDDITIDGDAPTATVVISSRGTEVSPAKAASRPAAPTGYRLQLAAASSHGAADAEWRRLQEKFGESLARLPSGVVAVDAGGITRYRVEAGAFAERDAALAGCRPFQSAGQACLVVEASSRSFATDRPTSPISLLRSPQ
jgi:outer membrane usher protein